jgi:short subunit dehydrogenase-like uncharacterized protein
MPPATDDPRELDIVVWGATGFTGRLVAEALLTSGASARIALAGRDRAKLQGVAESLSRTAEHAGDVELLIADASDRASLDALVERTRVVCTTVGPYARYGAALVAACVEAGTDYCDLCGEVQFMRETIDRYHADARDRGVRIVHSCGYDSVPSDLGTLMVQTEAARRWGRPLTQIKFFAGRSKGGVSGGTIASLLGVLEDARRDPELARVLADPYALDPEGSERGPDGPDQRGIRFDPDLEQWTVPFPMAPINTRVVRRSNALMNHRFGREFRYAESMSTGPGPSGLARAVTITAGLSGFLAAAAFGPTRALLRRTILPAPGEGPSEAAMRGGFFEVRLVGKGQDDTGAPVRLDGRVFCRADPGYRGTAIMLGESALCLALDRDSLAEETGVVTPASGIGLRLLDRLRAAGMIWEVQERPPGDGPASA